MLERGAPPPLSSYTLFSAVIEMRGGCQPTALSSMSLQHIRFPIRYAYTGQVAQYKLRLESNRGLNPKTDSRLHGNDKQIL